MGHFRFCHQCGVAPGTLSFSFLGPRAPLPDIDLSRLAARRATVTAAMADRPGQLRKLKIAGDFDAFVRALSGGRRGWETATPGDVFDWMCYLDTQGNGTKRVHVRTCPRVGTSMEGACPDHSGCMTQYAADSLRKGFVSKLRMAYKEYLYRGDDWDPMSGKGNPCGSAHVDSYLTYTTETQRQAGVAPAQAPALLSHILAALLVDMRARCTVAESVKTGIEITRDVALFALAFYSCRRGFDISNTLGSQVLRLPEDRGLIINFQFGKTLRDSKEAVLVLADSDNPGTCAFRAITTYIAAAQGVGWDLSVGHLFPFVENGSPEGVRGELPLTAPQMTTSLQSHLRAAGLPDHFTMHSFRVGGSLSKSLGGTPVDEIMYLGGWKTEAMAKHYIGPTTSGGAVSARQTVDQLYDHVNTWSASSDFQDRYAACGDRFMRK